SAVQHGHRSLGLGERWLALRVHRLIAPGVTRGRAEPAEKFSPELKSASYGCWAARIDANKKETAMQSTLSARALDTAKDAEIGLRDFDGQSSLPRVPLPTLEETSRRFMEWCEPLLTANELQDTKTALERFVRKGGPGELLQDALVAYNREPG